MKISRYYHPLESYLELGKVLVIYGPRQVGKTSLVQEYLATTSERYLFDTGDDLRIQNIFAPQDRDTILAYVKNYKLVVIDEAQKIPNIGIGLKMMVDARPDITLIVTGSSSFELAGQVGEPLIGRKNTITLFPIAQTELSKIYNDYELKKDLENYMIYGSYPEIITATTVEKKREKLEEIAYSYLLKDILEIDRIKNSKSLIDLLRLIAFQIGNEVSLHELGRQLGMNYKTIGRYLDLLEKSFILYRVGGFSRNLRNEITKMSKYYFYDIGIRNALISNFNTFDTRNDTGALWENFIFMERLKKRNYQKIYANIYFWRTWNQQEIDMIEDRDGKLHAYECKWNQDDIKMNTRSTWKKAYPEASLEVINAKNYLTFVV